MVGRGERKLAGGGVATTSVPQTLMISHGSCMKKKRVGNSEGELLG